MNPGTMDTGCSRELAIPREMSRLQTSISECEKEAAALLERMSQSVLTPMPPAPMPPHGTSMKTLGEIQQAVPPLGEQIRAQRDSIGRVTGILREIGSRLEV